MHQPLEICLCGPPNAAVSDSISNIAKLVPAADSHLMDTKAEEFNGFLKRSHADFIAFIDSKCVPSIPVVQQLVLAVRSDTRIAMAMAFSASVSFLQNAWSRFTPCGASLLAAPEREATIVFRRAMLQSTGPFRDVGAPIWDCVIRTIRGGHAVKQVSGAATDAHSSDSPDKCTGRSPMPTHSLAPEKPAAESNWLLNHLREVRPEELVQTVHSTADAIALKAGLLLWHDFLDESHQLAQSVEGEGINRAADYWHAIMHRREPDYSNSKYWYRRVGAHPIFPALARRAEVILSNSNLPEFSAWRNRLVAPDGWAPFAFVDLCQTCNEGQSPPLARAARTIQLYEMQLLLSQTLADAGGRDFHIVAEPG